MITEINTEQYDALDKNETMLVEVYSKTCGTCTTLAYVLKDIEKEFPKFPIYTIEYNENIELKDRLLVKVTPTLIFMKEGKEVNRLEGLMQKPVLIKEIEHIIS